MNIFEINLNILELLIKGRLPAGHPNRSLARQDLAAWVQQTARLVRSRGLSRRDGPVPSAPAALQALKLAVKTHPLVFLSPQNLRDTIEEANNLLNLCEADLKVFSFDETRKSADGDYEGYAPKVR